ncbi:hypothetical protein QUB80_01345 [Chlorogloeopsis sp. ULAP01]|nr:hypothetical protein [Chlorogloeopsis sp. ULAP01]MDM9379353.1 hypothetical protein [Chlorogloeopsis sp. ULAP01]
MREYVFLTVAHLKRAIAHVEDNLYKSPLCCYPARESILIPNS